MGKYAKFFPLDVQLTIAFVGAFMAVFTGFIAAFGLISYVKLELRHSSFQVAAMVFSSMCNMVYMVAAIQNCCLCCIVYKNNRDRFLNGYNIISLVVIICALIEGIIYSTVNIFVTFIFLSFSFVASLCLLVTFIGHRELRYSQFDSIQQYNSGQTGGIGRVEELPKFPVTVHVQKVYEDF